MQIKCNSWNIKLSEEKKTKEKNLCDLELGKKFLDITPKSQSTKEKKKN